jgi:hypothetical protein
MHRYEVILDWSDADQAFVAEVPELPGCMATGRPQSEPLPSPRRRSSSGSILPGSSAIRFPSPMGGA